VTESINSYGFNILFTYKSNITGKSPHLWLAHQLTTERFSITILFLKLHTVVRVALSNRRGWRNISMLQRVRSRFRFPMESSNFFSIPDPSSRNVVVGFTQPVTEISTRNIPGGKSEVGTWDSQPHRHLWADCLENVGSSMSHSSIGLHGLLQG
jgi:hypothetical protein